PGESLVFIKKLERRAESPAGVGMRQSPGAFGLRTRFRLRLILGNGKAPEDWRTPRRGRAFRKALGETKMITCGFQVQSCQRMGRSFFVGAGFGVERISVMRVGAVMNRGNKRRWV